MSKNSTKTFGIDAKTLGLILQGIKAAIAAAPGVVEVVVRAKEFIASLFSAGVISKEQQDRVHGHVDEICRAAIRGEEFPRWVVEADPE